MTFCFTFVSHGNLGFIALYNRFNITQAEGVSSCGHRLYHTWEALLIRDRVLLQKYWNTGCFMVLYIQYVQYPWYVCILVSARKRVKPAGSKLKKQVPGMYVTPFSIISTALIMHIAFNSSTFPATWRSSRPAKKQTSDYSCSSAGEHAVFFSRLRFSRRLFLRSSTFFHCIYWPIILSVAVSSMLYRTHIPFIVFHYVVVNANPAQEYTPWHRTL